MSNLLFPFCGVNFSVYLTLYVLSRKTNPYLFGKTITLNPQTLDDSKVFGFSVIIPYGHSAATMLLSNGFSLKEIQEWLGHADIGTTSNIYAHVQYKAKENMAKSVGDSIKIG